MLFYAWAAQVRSVPIRKDDEVQVVRGTFKVRVVWRAGSRRPTCSGPTQQPGPAAVRLQPVAGSAWRLLWANASCAMCAWRMMALAAACMRRGRAVAAALWPCWGGLKPLHC